MGEEQKGQENSKPQISNATVKKPSIMHELVKYSIDEVVIPQSKDAMSSFMKSVINMFGDAMTKSIDKAFYKDEVPRRQHNSSYGTYQARTNYTVYSKSNDSKPQRESINQRSSIDVNYIWVDTEAEARSIVSSLIEDVENYGKCKVATLYEMVKIPTTFTDFKFGWTDTKGISYYRDRGKYFIDLPKPINIENV